MICGEQFRTYRTWVFYLRLSISSLTRIGVILIKLLYFWRTCSTVKTVLRFPHFCTGTLILVFFHIGAGVSVFHFNIISVRIQFVTIRWRAVKLLHLACLSFYYFWYNFTDCKSQIKLVSLFSSWWCVVRVDSVQYLQCYMWLWSSASNTKLHIWWQSTTRCYMSRKKVGCQVL